MGLTYECTCVFLDVLYLDLFISVNYFPISRNMTETITWQSSKEDLGKNNQMSQFVYLQRLETCRQWFSMS